MSRSSKSPWLTSSPWLWPGVGALLVCAALPGDAAKSRRRARPAVKTAKSAPTRVSLNGELPPPRVAATKNAKPLPQFVSLQTIDTLRALRDSSPHPLMPVLQPFELQPGVGEIPLRAPMANLLTGPTSVPSLPHIVGKSRVQASKQVRRSTRRRRTTRRTLPRPASDYAQFPIPLPPAPIVRPRAPIVPRFVRYPLEFQLCGIAIGTRAVDKDRFNRIDRYGLFALHGNPTAIVVPAAGGGTVTVQQQPLQAGTTLFPASQDGELPDWAAAITVNLDNNHVEWLYKREGFSMGFVVDRLGYVDAIVAAGTSSPIARTQLEDPVHTVKLGDDLRKVLFRYGYPDTIETYGASAVASSGGGGGAGGAATPGDASAGQGQGVPSGAPGGRGGGRGGPPSGSGFPGAGGRGGASPSSVPGAGAGGAGGAEGAGGQNGAAAGGNSAYRTFEVRYEQSYNVVFTIRNNRVVRVYIFGDPDFFNRRRRENLRTRY